MRLRSSKAHESYPAHEVTRGELSKSGYRSSIATSLLKREGFTNVMNVIGGFDAWKACDLPVIG